VTRGKRAVEGSVLVDPALYLRIDLLGHLIQVPNSAVYESMCRRWSALTPGFGLGAPSARAGPRSGMDTLIVAAQARYSAGPASRTVRSGKVVAHQRGCRPLPH